MLQSSRHANVGSSRSTALSRGNAQAFASLCVSIKAIPTARVRYEERFSFVPITKWQKLKLRHLASRTTGGVFNERVRKEQSNEKTKS